MGKRSQAKMPWLTSSQRAARGEAKSHALLFWPKQNPDGSKPHTTQPIPPRAQLEAEHAAMRAAREAREQLERAEKAKRT